MSRIWYPVSSFNLVLRSQVALVEDSVASLADNGYNCITEDGYPYEMKRASEHVLHTIYTIGENYIFESSNGTIC